MTRPPDLQQLVEAFGAFDKITPEAWAEYDRSIAAWQAERRDRILEEQRQNRNKPRRPEAST